MMKELYTINNQTSLNKPSSRLKLFKEQFQQKYLSWTAL